MKQLFRNVCSALLAGTCLVWGVGCGLPPQTESSLQRDALTITATQARQLWSLHSTAKATLQTQFANAQAPQTTLVKAKQTHASTQPHAAVSSVRHLVFRMAWRGDTYEVSSDLLAPSYNLSVRVVQMPLRLQCIPGKSKRTVYLSPASNLGGVVSLKTQSQNQNELMHFEKNALELARKVWLPISKLWQKGHCIATGRCDSEIFSDITLDVRGEPQFNCQMTLLDNKQP